MKMNISKSELKIPEDTIISLTHCQQKETWDCGLSCAIMVMNTETKYIFMNQFPKICLEEGFDKSTWTIDLAYLLHRFGVDICYCTITLGVDPSLSSETFYKNILYKDYKRIQEKFDLASKNGVTVEKRAVSLESLLTHLSNKGPLILLVNANLLNCDKCMQGGSRLSAYLQCSTTGYQGHYVVLVGYNIPSSIFYYRNPSLNDKVCNISFSDLDEARKSFGTDQDVIFVYQKC